MKHHVPVFALSVRRFSRLLYKRGSNEIEIAPASGGAARAPGGSVERVLACVLLALALSVLEGCATLVDILNDMPYSNTELELRSTPLGAQVKVLHDRTEVTPAFPVVKTNQKLALVCTLEGYEPQVLDAEPRLNPWLWMNVLNAGLGLIVDFWTGSAWKMSPDEFHFVLTPGTGTPREVEPPSTDPSFQRAPREPGIESGRPAPVGTEGPRDSGTPPGDERSDLTLSWDAPETKQDGTALTNLSGYRIYVGREPGRYERYVDVGLVTRHTFEDLDRGVYYFAITAIDRTGNESVPSKEIRREVK